MIIGIEIGGTKLKVHLADNEQNIVKTYTEEVGELKDASAILQKIEKIVVQLCKTNNIDAIGVGFGGLVNRQTGIVSASHQVNGWENFNLKMWLENLASAPVYIDNDSNCAALAEATNGAGKNKDKVFYINMGSGVGGGFVTNSEIYHGNFPGEFEIGHIVINDKKDTVEKVCSGWAIDNKIIEYAEENPKCIIAKLIHDRTNKPASYLLEAISKGDEGAKMIFDELQQNLAKALSYIVLLLRPDVVILGGGIALLGEQLRKGVEQKLPEYIIPTLRIQIPEIKLAQLKEDMVGEGAILLAKSQNKIKKSFLGENADIKQWIHKYIEDYRDILSHSSIETINNIIKLFYQANQQGNQIFTFGNGGSAASASHFVTDMAKGASDKLEKRFKIMSLNEHTGLLTALGNDYNYDDVFLRQLENFAKPGDIAFTMSVSGNSPNLVKAIEWSNANGIETIALVGGKRGKLAQIAKNVVIIDSEHYGKVEDMHMLICHMIGYAFMEKIV